MGRIAGLLVLWFVVAMTGFNVAALSWLATLGLVLLVVTSFFGAIKAQAVVDSAIALGLDEFGMVDSGHHEASTQPGGRPTRPLSRTDGRRSSPPLQAT
jgi:hypothetical protein